MGVRHERPWPWLGHFRFHRVGGGRHHAHLRCDLGVPLSRGCASESRRCLFGTSLKTYGWVYLIVGIILILCSLAVLGRSPLGRWVGIAAGAIGAISAIWWMPYYPIWSLTYIALGVFVIYALAAYGAPAETPLSPQELSRL